MLVSLGLFMIVRLALDHEQLGTGICVCGLHEVSSRPGSASGLDQTAWNASRRVLTTPDQMQDRPGELEPVAAFSRGGGFGLE